MNEKDILKALECCTAYGWFTCTHCSQKCLKTCKGVNPKATLDLIKRQQAEIEKLTTQNVKLKKYFTIEFDDDKLKKIVKKTVDRITIDIKQAKNETIREFAERLKRESELVIPYRLVSVDEIDDLVKEMTGGET